MATIRVSLVALSAASFLIGCSLSPTSLQSPSRPAPPVMTPELRMALKLAYGGDGWEDYVAYDPWPARAIDAELRKVGAKLAADGKMYDRNGKEIYLWSNGIAGGMARTAEDLAQQHQESQRALEETRRHYTVIVIQYHGPQPP